MRIITDIFAFCKDRVPKWNTISISGYHIREAGSTAAQEIAFTLANGIAYVQAAIDAGMSVDSFASRLAFFFNAHNTFLEEVAKFRAARRLWARIMRERFRARDPRSWMLRFHTQTAGSSLTAQQPDNNIVRVTVQALAAVLGGTQSLHTNSRDEALSLPTEDSVRIALRTQQVLAHESGVGDTVDPLGGSYCVEAMTSLLERQAEEYIEKIDRMGGVVSAIDRGFVQKEIQDAAFRYQQEIERKDRIIVGMNEFTVREPRPENLLTVDPKIEKAQRQRLANLRKKRDNRAVRDRLSDLEKACRGKSNLMPPIVAAVTACATLGEISDVMRGVFGTYRGKITI
jgi:methylmalonyl-CoA mutase N-terminal domain/subunit